MRLLILFLCFTSATVHGVSDAQRHSTSLPIARTRNGTYVGVHVPQYTQDIFRGIPFAHAPRLSLAEPLTETWSGTRDAVEPGLTCSGFGTNNLLGLETGEYCLNLNVVRPAGVTAGTKLPVMVWIYGGAFSQGSINDREFNTSYIVQTSIQINKPVIVVSINYRLSAMGWLFSIEVLSQGVTNLGLRDQWKALEWIQENIEGFGGDPDNVTLWGESAGAFSIAWLTLAYSGQNSGLFHKAITVSGTSFGSGYGSFVNAQTAYNSITNATGCYYAIDSLQCLRELPFETLNETLITLAPVLPNFQPILDGDILRNSPSFAYDHVPPLLAPIDLLLGCNSDEGMSEAFGAKQVINNSAELAGFITAFLDVNSSTVSEILDLWPEDAQYPPYSEPMTLNWPVLTATVGVASGPQTRRLYGLINDVIMHAGRRLVSQSWTKLTGKRAYSFRWDVDPSRLPLVYTPGLGVGFAQHGADLSFEFGLPHVYKQQYPVSIPIPDVPAMRRVSYAMHAHFIGFASDSDPNAHGIDWIPEWPAYKRGAEKNFVYNATLRDTLNLHLEDDNYRAEQLEWVNQRWPLLNKF